MRLHSGFEQLPSEEGELWTHDTGGEHAPKFFDQIDALNALRRLTLQPRGEETVSDIASSEFGNMLLGGTHNVVLVYRNGGDPEKRSSSYYTQLVAGAIGHFSSEAKFHRTVQVEEIMVHPDFRNHRLAGFMLKELLNQPFGLLPAAEMVFNTQTYTVDKAFLDKLTEVGFTHTDKRGEPAMWLPGQIMSLHEDIDGRETVIKRLSQVPHDWNGAIQVGLDADFRTDIFRYGQVVGRVRQVGNRRWDDDANDAVQTCDIYRVSSGADSKIATLTDVTEDEALWATLNNYGLVEPRT